ncbi:MAG: hypothetical protein FWD28_10710 [Treponema sp.]|nr:hypothetical protein [Treponema sp.]
MKKKLILVLVIMALAVTGAFADFGFSIGGGAVYSDLRVSQGGVSMGASAVGVSIFVDATYVESSLGCVLNPKINGMYLTISLLGKYPFEITDNLIIYPTAGLDIVYLLAFSEMNRFLDIGAGIDYFFGDSFFIRAVGTYGFGVFNDVPSNFNLSHIKFRVAAGYRF